MTGIQITWLGTAGFSICAGGTHILMDPHLSRPPRATPHQPWDSEDLVRHLGEPDAAFLSHGHFDHAMDLPALAAAAPDMDIYCNAVPARKLQRLGVPDHHIYTVTPNTTPIPVGEIHALPRPSRHVRFDLPLIFSTPWHGGLEFFRLMKNYPCGQVLSWRFRIRGKNILFFGSAGPTKRELTELAKEETYLLMLPLQGHSKICNIAANMVDILRPKHVLPHHMDDFYPPISQSVDLQPFLDRVRTRHPEIRIRIPEINTTMEL